MKSRVLMVVALAILGGGCAGRAHVTYSTWVADRPPEPLVEIVPEAPGPEYLWVNGYWHWDDGDWVWVRGHWALRPVEGYVWVRSGWIAVDGRYRFVPGRWTRPGPAPRFRYVYPAPPIQRGPSYRSVPPRSSPPPPRGR